MDVHVNIHQASLNDKSAGKSNKNKSNKITNGNERIDLIALNN